MRFSWTTSLALCASTRRSRRAHRCVGRIIQVLERRDLLAADLDDQPEEATAVTTPAFVQGLMDSKTDVDAFRFELQQGVQVTISISEQDGTAFTPDAQLFGPFSSSRPLTLLTGPSTGSFQFTALKTGTHYVTVANHGLTFNFSTGFDGTPPLSATTGNYLLRISTSDDPPGIEQDTYEPNNSFAQTLSAILQQQDHTVTDLTIDNPADNDFFSWTAPGNGALNVSTLVTEGDGNIDLFLYNSQQGLLASSTTAGSSEAVSIEVRYRQQYFVRVQPVGQTTIPEYNLILDGPESPADRFESNNTSSTAANLGEVTTSGLLVENLTLHTSTDTDWFRFTPNRSGRLSVQRGGEHANDFFMQLLDESLTDLGIVAGTPLTPTPNILSLRAEVAAGKTYYIKTTTGGNLVESYQLSVQLADGPDVALGDVSIQEGNSGTKNAVFTVRLSSAPQDSLPIPLSIAYATQGGTATSGVDFTAVSGRVTFGNGEREKTILVPIRGDQAFEENETFSLVLSDARGANLPDGSVVGLGTILNDDREVLVDLAYTAKGKAVLNAVVAENGRLQVRLGTAAQTDVDPATVRSLTFRGTTGNDVIDLTGLSPSLYRRLQTVIIDGGGGNDLIIGSEFDEVITGGIGDDTIFGEGGRDRLVESGNVNFVLDDFSLTGVGTDEIHDLEEVSLTGGAGNNTLDASGFQFGRVTLSGGAGNDVLIGSDGDDLLDGGAGKDSLRGENGNDTLTGGADTSNDSLAGGSGDDLLREMANANLTLTDSLLVGAGTDSLSSLEQVSLTGGTGANKLNAAGFTLGGVSLNGAGGNDSLAGTAFADLLDGGAGNDTLRGGAGNDTLLGGTGSDALAGQDGDDSVLGVDGKDTLIGGVGNDTLLGGNADDLLIGGFGDDSILGESGRDKAVGGQGKSGNPRNGTSSADHGDQLTAELIDETFATLFAFE